LRKKVACPLFGPDGNDDGWEYVVPNCTWSVINGEYRTSLSGYRVECISAAGNPNWADYIFEADVYGDGGVDKVIVFRYQDSDNFYSVNLRSDWEGQDQLLLLKEVDGIATTLATVIYPSINGMWYHLKVSAIGETLRVWVDDNKLCEVLDASPIKNGRIAVDAWTGDYGYVALRFDNILVAEAVSQPEGKLGFAYPILMVHGIDGDSASWNTLVDSLKNVYNWKDGGVLHVNLDSSSTQTSIEADVGQPRWENKNSLGQFFRIDFREDPPYNLSNQAAIRKEGPAIRDCIDSVGTAVRKVTGRDRVILFCHSMGGLGGREYLQRVEGTKYDHLWWVDQLNQEHKVGKYVSVDSPHLGWYSSLPSRGGPDSQELTTPEVLPTLADRRSDGARDCMKNYPPLFAIPGVYLYGGREMDVPNSYYDKDVNCDGDENDDVMGLNYLPPPPGDIEYSCIVVVGDIGWSIPDSSANLNNLYSGIADTFEVRGTSHSKVTGKLELIMKALDESDSPDKAYPIQQGDPGFQGFITYDPRSSGSYEVDKDYFKVNIWRNPVHILLSDLRRNCALTLFDADLKVVKHSNNPGTQDERIDIDSLELGNYYIRVGGRAGSVSYLQPYSLRVW